VGGLTVATMMAGVILIILGLARLGAAIKFIPFPVTLGFTSGIALVILTSQVPDLFGLDLGGPAPADFIGKWTAYVAHMGTSNGAAIAVAAGSLAIVLGWPRLNRRIPSPFIAIVAATLVVRIFDLDVATIGSRFGAINAHLPRPQLPPSASPRYAPSSDRRSRSQCSAPSNPCSRPSSPMA
jgi:sulfate permease, SulP family